MKFHSASIRYVHPKTIQRLESRISRNITRQTDPAAEKSVRRDIDAGRYSFRCTYRKIEHLVTYAAGVAVSGRTAILRLEGEVAAKLTAPAGWGWKIDSGMAILFDRTRPDCDLHLTREEWFAPIDELIATANANYARRQWEDAIVREREAFSEQVERAFADLSRLCKVTRQDSINAGNCLAGTEDFAAKYAPGTADDPYAGLRADVLIRVGGRAELAAKMAVLRQTEVAI